MEVDHAPTPRVRDGARATFFGNSCVRRANDRQPSGFQFIAVFSVYFRQGGYVFIDVILFVSRIPLKKYSTNFHKIR